MESSGSESKSRKQRLQRSFREIKRHSEPAKTIEAPVRPAWWWRRRRRRHSAGTAHVCIGGTVRYIAIDTGTLCRRRAQLRPPVSVVGRRDRTVHIRWLRFPGVACSVEEHVASLGWRWCPSAARCGVGCQGCQGCRYQLRWRSDQVTPVRSLWVGWDDRDQFPVLFRPSVQTVASINSGVQFQCRCTHTRVLSEVPGTASEEDTLAVGCLGIQPT